MSFIENYNKDVSKYVEVKGSGNFQAKYLSWAYAVRFLKESFPEATTETVFYNGLPYLSTELGYFVTTRVYLTKEDRLNDLGHDYTFPVLDHRFNTVMKPNAFQINTSIQRCLVKNIAVVTGLGLSLYSGEDLPQDTEVKPEKPQPKETKPAPQPEIKTDWVKLTFDNNEADPSIAVLGCDNETFQGFLKAYNASNSESELKDNLDRAFKYWSKKDKKAKEVLNFFLDRDF